MKQAFLIIAHADFLILQKLILALECPEVDFYVHIDAKVKVIPDLYVSGESSLNILRDRIDTRWGDYSQIATEMLLLEKSFRKGYYSHYHIISGTHFPIKPVKDIVSFYDGQKGKVILSRLCRSTTLQETLKVRHYNLFTRRLVLGTTDSRRLIQRLWNMSHIVQNALKIRRNKNVDFYKASNWASFTDEAVDYLLKEKRRIRKVFRWSYCGDEYFAPTILKTSPLEKDIVSFNSILKQELGDANTRVYTMDDFDALVASGCLFARKFSDNQIEVVNRISEYIKR